MNKNSKSLKWIWKYTKKYALAIIAMSIFSGLIAVIYVGLALVSRQAIDIATGDSEGSIIFEFVLLSLLIIGQIFLNVLNSSIRVRVNGKFDISLKQGLLDSYIDKRYSKVCKIHSGEILNRFTSDIDIVVTGVVSIIPQTISMIAKVASGLFVLVYLNSSFAVIIGVLGVLLIILGRLFNIKFKYLHKLCQQTSGVVRGYLQECVENIVVIKTFSNKIPVINKLSDYMDKSYKLKIKRNTISLFASTGISLLFTLGYYATLAWGALQVAANTMSFGTLTAFLQIVSQIRAPFYNMSGIIPQYYSTIASAERLMEIEDIESEPAKIEIDPIKIYNSMTELVINNLSFGYNDEMIIENSSLNIKKSSLVSIIGASGTGKSTLFRLLLGLFDPTHGQIYINCGNGKIDIDSRTRCLFAYVPQGNLILSGTIRENIAFGNINVDNAAIEQAAKASAIFDFIDTLPDKFETMLGERGLGLSEGQIQRIAIARALICDAPILLLDECTSALDEQTEHELLQNIKNLKTKTVIFISHRPAALDISDSIIKLENKKFVVQ
ncbi:MAG: ABC transporter ATP-binding protein [Oscillospiraceae bacterium]|nr:ABC transporter ATP-binding protein [Oscillospiraceae bacterium]